MKKTLRKPENWQDFESLCKKLWGELWEIPYEIKKNGRLGQPQAGVDVFGVPNAKLNYYGIQAKGKDDYSNSKVDIREIENEITKALQFEPKLDVFIIATTSNKDVKIEEFVRKKDLESREKGSFKILLFCWEDIADLIEQNRETFNWYVNENNFRDKFDVELYINIEYKVEDVINPKFEKIITSYNVGKSTTNYQPLMIINPIAFTPLGYSNETNHTWCEIKIIVKNTGSVVIEDWKLTLKISDNVEKISDGFYVNWMLSDTTQKMMYENRTTFKNEVDKSIFYKPYKNSPLIQNDTKIFSFFVKPFCNSEDVVINWKLLARDFNKEGSLMLKNNPLFEISNNIILVDSHEKIQEENTKIKDYITSNLVKNSSIKNLRKFK